MKQIPKWLYWALFFLCSVLITGTTIGETLPPPPPPVPGVILGAWNFNDTNWLSSRGFPPLSYTNLISVEDWDRSALQVDSSNQAWLAYNVVEANGHTNFMCGNGTISVWFIPNWESTNIDGGTGPGNWANLIDAGSWSSNAMEGWWSLYFDPSGTKIYFSAQADGTNADYLEAPISWDADSWHLITLAYSPTNSALYLDGIVVTNGAGVGLMPPPAILTNGFFVGSDVTGTEQAHGLFEDLRIYSYELDAVMISNYYEGILPELPTDDESDSDGSGGTMMEDFSFEGPSGDFSGNYGTNLFLQILGTYTNLVPLYLRNTESDVMYEILTKQNLLDSDWRSEGFIYGAEGTNWTGFFTWEGSRTNALFFTARSWVDSTGSGIPDWWWLQYFGQATNVDAYANPTGDGYDNLEKFESGLNPTNYYNPNPPSPFFGCLDSSGTNYVLEWNPAPGPVANYVIQRAYYNSTNNGYDIFPVATVSSNTTFFKDVGAVYRGYFFWIYYSDSEDFYTLTAVYPGGISSGTSTWWISDGSPTPTNVYSYLDLTSSNIFLSWSAAPGQVTNYLVEREFYTNSAWVDLPIASLSSNTFSYEVVGAITNQASWGNSYGVVAVYPGGGYSQIKVAPSINLNPTNSPAGPYNLNGYREGNGTNVYLYWTPVTGAVSNYVIYGEQYNYTVQAWQFVKLGTVSATTNFFEAKGTVVSGSSLYYYYDVQAVYADRSVSKPTDWYYSSASPPDPEAFIAYIDSTGTNIVLAWTAGPGPVTNYVVKESANGGYSYYQIATVNSNMTWYVDTNGISIADPDDGLTYVSYQIKAVYPHNTMSPGIVASVDTNFPAPTGLSANIDATGTNLTVSWNPPPGIISSYTILRGVFNPASDSYDYSSIGTVSGSTTFTYSGVFKSDDLIQVVANELGGHLSRPVFSSLIAPYHSTAPTTGLTVTAQMIRNESGRWQLMFSSIPANVQTIAFYWYIYDYWDDIGPNASDSSAFTSETDIPVSSITNNIYVIPFYWLTNWVPTSLLGKVAMVQPIGVDGQYGAISQAGFQSYDSPTFVDARVHLKQNLLHKLRSANVTQRNSSLREDNVWDNPLFESYPVPDGDTNYVESSFFHWATIQKGYTSSDSFFFNYLKRDNVWPIIANYQYHEAAYDPTYTNESEFIWQHDLGTYYHGFNNAFQGTLDTIPAPPVLDRPDPYWVQQDMSILSDLAAYTDGNDFYLLGGSHNLFGLSFETAMVNPRGWRYDEDSDTWVFDPPITVDPGGSPVGITNADPSMNVSCFFSQTAVPTLQLTNYYFASVITYGTGLIGEAAPTQPYPLPALDGFAATNQTGLIIASVGEPSLVACWAKYSILNGDPNKFAYLGQYFFTNAFVVTNGIVTTNISGVISPYGDFFPTDAGIFALKTMPDLDTGLTSTGIVRTISLNVDANRDGVIDYKFNGPDFVSTNKPYRFWVNDNNDDGDFTGDGIPGLPNASADGTRAERQDYHDNPIYTVKGTRDLDDFFPVYVNVRNLLRNVPGSPAIDPYDVHFRCRLKQGDGALRFAYTTLTPTNFMDYLRKTDAAQSLQSAELTTVTADGVDLPDWFFATETDPNLGVILVEAWKPTTAPLVLEIWHDTNLIGTASLSLSITGVEQMFRNKNMMLNSKPGMVPDRLTDAQVPNEPDTINKSFVFIHGYNVLPKEARGVASDVFKRLFWSGSQAKFWAVTWEGADTKGEPPFYNYLTPNYHTNVGNAFITAPILAEFIRSITNRGPVIVAAHSLGNMLTLSAISDWNAPISKYFMIDAAVAIEAIDPDAVTNIMIYSTWTSYTNRLYANEWYHLFASGDNRSKLTWANRFGNLGSVDIYNCFSSGEEVLRTYPYDPPDDVRDKLGSQAFHHFWDGQPFGTFTWYWQEKGKGTCEQDWFLGSSHGGWQFNPNYDTFGLHLGPSYAAVLTDSQLRTNPFCGFNSSIGDHSDMALIGADGSQYAADHLNRILADAIPARSLAVAANPIPSFDTDHNLDMKLRFENGWPAGRTGSEVNMWHHSDFHDVAYLFTYKLYDKFVATGNLK